MAFANKDVEREYFRKWRAANRDKLAAYGAKWYAANKPKILEKNRRYRAAHPDKFRAIDRLKRGLPAPTRPEAEHCEICGIKEKMNLDHCHKTHGFRGWLCGGCNRGLGQFGDNPVKLEKALEYLRSYDKAVATSAPTTKK